MPGIAGINRKLAILSMLICGFPAMQFGSGSPADKNFTGADERVYVHLQKQVFISGEPLIYKAYAVDHYSLKPTDRSKVVYFAVRGPGNRPVLKWRGDLVHGLCSGSVILPDTISCGIYTLFAFTNRMRNFSPAYFYNSNILITKVNDSNPDRLNCPVPRPKCRSPISFFPEGDSCVEGLVFLEKKNKPGIKLMVPESDYGVKAKISMEIEAVNFPVDDTLNLSVSVTTASPFQSRFTKSNIDTYLLLDSGIRDMPFTVRTHSTDIQPDDLLPETDPGQYAREGVRPDEESGNRYYTEDKGFVLSGNIAVNDSLSPLGNAVVLLAYADSIAWLDYSRTDTSGNFHFLIDKQRNNRDPILQLENPDLPAQKLIWTLDNKYANLPQAGYYTVYLKEADKRYLDLRRKVYMIGKVYGQFPESLAVPAAEKGLSFYGYPDYSIYPADYIELNDFADISENILPGVRFRNKKDSLALNMLSLEKGEYFANGATVLLNGVPLNDLSFLSPLGSKDILNIELVLSEVIYGDLSFYGIISVRTGDRTMPTSYLNRYACIYKNTVYKDGSDLDTSRIRNREESPIIPDLRETLYWNPGLTIRGNDKITIEFSASDLLSEYEISVQGISARGIPVSASAHFKVKK